MAKGQAGVVLAGAVIFLGATAGSAQPTPNGCGHIQQSCAGAERSAAQIAQDKAKAKKDGALMKAAISASEDDIDNPKKMQLVNEAIAQLDKDDVQLDKDNKQVRADRKRAHSAVKSKKH